MVQQKMVVEYPEGTHLAQAQIPGGYRGLARDDGTNELETHAVLFPINDDEDGESLLGASPPFCACESDGCVSEFREEEPSLSTVLIGTLLLVGTVKAAEVLAPYATRLWNDQALPAIGSAWNWLTRTRGADRRVTTDESVTSVESASADSSPEVLAALEECRASMSGAEAWERFVAALMARLYSEEQLRLLRSARIEDAYDPAELKGLMEGLTPQQIADSITLMLETNPSSAQDETSVELGQVLERIRAIQPNAMFAWRPAPSIES
ncbi:hypothetical protein SAMN05444351_3094 [Geodermatophilus nigrescens]|uniref:Uncharacterized protein n=2 Tax=Geodermatophilus nigrescens TaxID=1070870 RepID=A0A1M5MA38_9ACTN|nr:hypothetical protein SAMN05444351_3094 [Geodermatophilus nigrescens]